MRSEWHPHSNTHTHTHIIQRRSTLTTESREVKPWPGHGLTGPARDEHWCTLTIKNVRRLTRNKSDDGLTYRSLWRAAPPGA